MVIPGVYMYPTGALGEEQAWVDLLGVGLLQTHPALWLVPTLLVSSKAAAAGHCSAAPHSLVPGATPLDRAHGLGTSPAIASG